MYSIFKSVSRLINILRVFVVYLLFVSCEEPYQHDLQTEETNLIVVEGVVTNAKTNHLIKITHPYHTQNELPMPATGALVQLTEDNTITYALIETPVGSGNYYTPEMRASTGKTYTLHIVYNGRSYSAQDSPVPVEPMPEIKFESINDHYKLIPETSGVDPNYINHDISWANTASCISGHNCEGKIVSYDLKTLDVNDIIYKPNRTDFYFPAGTTIIRSKYSTSPAYRAFLRAVLSESAWRGGVFDLQRDNVPTNLSSGAIGFFAVSTMVTDTTVVNP